MAGGDAPGGGEIRGADGLGDGGPPSSGLPDGPRGNDEVRERIVKILAWLPLGLLSAAIAEVVLARPDSRISLTIIVAACACTAALVWIGVAALRSWRRRRPADVAPTEAAGGSAHAGRPGRVLPGRRGGGDGRGTDAAAIRFYARRAEFHAADLVVPGSRRGAEEWFAAEADRMIELLSRGGARAAERRRLAVIAGAVESWLVRQRRTADLRRLADAMEEGCERAVRRRGGGLDGWSRRTARRAAGRPDAELRGLARITRAAALRLDGYGERAEEELGAISMTDSGSLSGRENNAWAVLRLREAEHGRVDGKLSAHQEDDALQEAESCLRDAVERLPASDLHAWIGVRINLGVLCLRLGEPQHARHHFTEAEWLARQLEDHSAEAHAVELGGVAEWRLGDRAYACRRWRAARDLFEGIGEDAGLARCLLHGGTALLVQPDLGAELSDEPGPWTETRAAALALEHIDRSIGLRHAEPAGSPGLLLAHRHRDQAERLLRAGRGPGSAAADATPV
ncbi:tetratricopeptide (TPR) repeat protein [Actinoalloteichus hoggarensis]|uniref:Uncharacterized protein n=1 Tax=Actinoalloteichus hoggarensis TaxID=1470176 RepID=A0A221W094_9PSEU|nr:hypothetical protein [Actinoalloteichus hoggarensis]ASO19183.1 hypothetical protein AHOG_07690 [Actinoalloteichus hoggarensis]MBB5920419.1 tetratricopeptide (TPR) repeat protein [Actinoalloteichus hoggarensis]